MYNLKELFPGVPRAPASAPCARPKHQFAVGCQRSHCSSFTKRLLLKGLTNLRVQYMHLKAAHQNLTNCFLPLNNIRFSIIWQCNCMTCFILAHSLCCLQCTVVMWSFQAYYAANWVREHRSKFSVKRVVCCYNTLINGDVWTLAARIKVISSIVCL